MIKQRIKPYLTVCILGIVSFFLVADLFFLPAKPQTFDGWTHLITVQKFAESIRQGGVPVGWVDGVANYGYPLGQVAHQTTSYIAAGLLILSQNLMTAYATTWFLGAFLSSLFLYLWLRFYVGEEAALAGSLLFNFAPYRILNIYVRSAVPEFFASVFFPLSLIALYLWLEKKSWWGVILFILSVGLLILTHPMMLIPWAVLIGCYFIYLVGRQLDSKKLKQSIFLVAAGIWGVAISSYYFGPLLLEMKYFYYAEFDLTQLNFEYLMPDDLVLEKWNFIGPDSIGIRENRKQLGMLEAGLLVGGLIYLLNTVRKKKKLSTNQRLLTFSLVTASIFIVLASPLAAFLYQNSQFLASLQHPWRFLTGLIFIPPIILAILIDQTKSKFQLLVLVCLLVGLIRFPQVYGRNYIDHVSERYTFSIENLHSTNMNTIWTGSTLDYPKVSQKIEVLEGQAVISNQEEAFNHRSYQIESTEQVRMVDRTFYFPGWKLVVDGQEQPIEFQDPLYRGVITYRLEPGTHQVELRYDDTKIRLMTKGISLVAILGLVGASLLVWRREQQLTDFFFKNR